MLIFCFALFFLPQIIMDSTTARVRLPRPRNSVPSISHHIQQQQQSDVGRRSSAPVVAITHLENSRRQLSSSSAVAAAQAAASSSYQRYTFPNITPPSVVQSQRRASSHHHQQQQQHQHQQFIRASQFIGDHPGLVTPVKPVYKLNCRHCSTAVCARGMKAILLADTTIELYSTDTPSQR